MRLKLGLQYRKKKNPAVKLVTQEFLVFNHQERKEEKREGKDTNKLSHKSLCNGQKLPKFDEKHEYKYLKSSTNSKMNLKRPTPSNIIIQLMKGKNR